VPGLIVGIDHVQLGMTAGREDDARRFWAETLGLDEVTKPESLAGRGGVWFQCGPQQVHCGVEPEVAASRRHPALVVTDLDAVRERLETAGYPIRFEPEIPGYRRLFSEDPFGNRVEFLQPI
jgi:catechol 2,3-dioxygenase-like lactoylglutathione lyase family enzyme